MPASNWRPSTRRWPTRCGPIAAAICRTSAGEIEQDLFSGNLRGVAATNALELGIDIGSLDVALLGELSRHDRQQLAAGGPQRPAARRKPGRAAWRATTRSTSTCCGIRSISSRSRRSTRSSIRTIRTCWPSTCRRRRSSCRSGRSGDLDRFGPLAAPIAGALERRRRSSSK